MKLIKASTSKIGLIKVLVIILVGSRLAGSLSNTVNAQLLKVPEVSRDKVICFALYTVNDNIMKLTAQLYPLLEGEDRMVRLAPFFP